MNKKGQFQFIKLLGFIGVFLVIFSFALAPFVKASLDISNLSILGSFGEFLIGGLNIWFFAAFLLLVFAALIYGFTVE